MNRRTLIAQQGGATSAEGEDSHIVEDATSTLHATRISIVWYGNATIARHRGTRNTSIAQQPKRGVPPVPRERTRTSSRRHSGKCAFTCVSRCVSALKAWGLGFRV
eukprot:123140-Rhodomonas_salina.1